jgi:transposase
MKPKFKDIIDLHEQGYTPDQIVAETGISRATAYRWIEQYNASLSISGQSENETTDEEIETEIDVDADADIETESLSGLELKNKELQLREREIEAQERKEWMAIEKLKREILKDFKKVIQAIKDDSSESSWSAEELHKVSLEIEMIQEKVLEVFGYGQEETEDNSILKILNILKEVFREDPDIKGKILDFSDAKIAVLDFGLEIENVEDTDFDLADYNRDSATDSFTTIMEEIAELQGYKLSQANCEQLLFAVQRVKENLTSELPGVDGEFEQEVQLLDNIVEELQELQVRCSENFWGEKSFHIDPSILEEYQELVSEEVE